MQTVILAGGLGTRLRSITGDVPKPLVTVNGAPFLLHLVRMLQRHGLYDFLFLLGYQHEMIVEFLQSGSIKDAKLDWSIESEPMGTGGALKLAEPKIKDHFLLINGDSYLDMDYRSLINTYEKNHKQALMVVYDNAMHTDVTENVKVDREGCIAGYDKENRDGSMTHVDAGALVFNNSILASMPNNQVCSLEKEIYPILINQQQMLAYPIVERFYDIGTPDRYAEFEEIVRDHIKNTI